jgi:hypothetical protein
VILRILVQESPDSELRWKRYEGLKFGGLKYEFGKVQELLWKIAGALVERICNLEQWEGLKCKNGGMRDYLRIDFKSQGPDWKIC